MDFLIIQCKT